MVYLMDYMLNIIMEVVDELLLCSMEQQLKSIIRKKIYIKDNYE